MATKNRRVLEQLLKQWAQNHSSEYQIADYDNTEEALKITQDYFNWLIQKGFANIDLFSLIDQLELWLENKKNNKYPGGMICNKCTKFADFAEPNQDDGSFLCYSCRNNPYI